jgi:PAS domain S-box-containing protein
MPNLIQTPVPAPEGGGAERRFLDRRLRLGLWLILAATLLFPALELLTPAAAEARVESLLIQGIVIVVVLLRLARGESDAVAETLATMMAVAAAIVGIGALRADAHTPLVLFTLVAFIAATLLAWRPWAQVALALGIATAALAVLRLTPPESLPSFSTLAAFGLGQVLAVYIAFELGQTRHRIREEALERERTAAALQLVESAVEQANDAVVILTPDLQFPGPQIVYVNPAFCAMTGYTADEAANQPLRALFGPGTGTNEIARLHESLRLEESQIGQGTFHRKDGTPYVLEWHTASIRDDAGRTIYRMTVNREITERVEAESGRAALLEVARSIGGRLDRTEILERVQGRIADLLPCDRVLSVRWDPDSQTFRFAAAHGFPDDQLPRLHVMEHRPTEALRQQLLAGRSVVVNEPVGQGLMPITLFSSYGIAALAITPLHARGRMLGGILVANTRRGQRFVAGQVQLLEGIGRQVALAWDGAELYRLQREDARVARALATVGEEMISSLSTPVLQERLCDLTMRVLECESSHTLLWRPEEHAYVIANGAGDPQERREALRVLHIPPAEVIEVFRNLRREEVVTVHTDGADADADPAVRLLRHYDLGATVCIALRRGDEVIGCQLAHAATPDHVFTEVQLRIARGVGQLASMALENARLVEESERANRLKSEFVATMSHELRTPLNVVIGYNELLLDGAYGDLSDDQRQPLGRADKSARELSAMIDAILDLNRLDKPQVPLHLEAVSVADLVDEVIIEDRNLEEKPQLHVVREIDFDLPAVRSDRIKLKMIIKNLFGNAVKFTEQGTITVAARAVHPGVEIRISDTGIGIAPEAQAYVFDPFRQVDGSDSRRYGGLGLGLYIVRRLVDVLGGTVALESTPGDGSTFRVWIPLTVAWEGIDDEPAMPPTPESSLGSEPAPGWQPDQPSRGSSRASISS